MTNVARSTAAMLLVSALVLGGCALQSYVPGGSTADSSGDAMGSGSHSSSRFGAEHEMPIPVQAP